MTVDHYAGAAPGWAGGAYRVYRPLARELVSMAPVAGLRILDVGAGTGLGSAELIEAGACPLAVDYSLDMLRWDRSQRPPCAVADVTALPVASGAVDGVLAAFVLNHLDDPGAGMRELARVARAGGPVLANVYSNASSNPARDEVDRQAVAHGWQVPEWYRAVKELAAPQVGTAEAMHAVASAAGLVDVVVEERAVDVGVETAPELVGYRLGQAHFAEWLRGLGPREPEVRAAIVEAVEPVMEPLRPIVVFLAARAA